MSTDRPKPTAADEEEKTGKKTYRLFKKFSLFGYSPDPEAVSRALLSEDPQDGKQQQLRPR